MPRIRNNNASFPAAAVSDTAGVAATQRGPLHPASQGPLAPVAVFDTAAVAASRRVTVSDTVASTVVAAQAQAAAVVDTAAVAMGVVDTSIASHAQAVAVSDTATVVVPLSRPCLKKTLKYTAHRPSKAQVQSTLRKVDEEDDKNVNVFEAVARGLLHMEKHNKKVFDKVMKVYKKSHLRKALEDALVKYACGRAQEFKDLWKVCWANYMDNKPAIREHRREQVKAHYEDLETVLAEADNSTPKVSFASATVKQYVLTEWERVHIKLGEASRKLQLLYELPWEPHTKYESFAPVPSQSIKRGGISAYVKDHMDLDAYSKRQLMLATRDWIRNGNVEALALHQQPLPRSNFTATAVFETPAQSQSNDVVDTSSAVVSDTTATPTPTPTPTQSTQQANENVIDTSRAVRRRRRRQASVVSDTTEVPQQSSTTEESSPAIVDMAVPLRRSARIAARSGASTPAPAAPVRRTTRKGAVKPKGFYKV